MYKRNITNLYYKRIQKNKPKAPEPRAKNIGFTILNYTIEADIVRTMKEARAWGRAMFGPGGYEIEQEW